MTYIIYFLGVIVRGFIAIVLAVPCFYTMMIPDMVESMNTFSFLIPLSIILNFLAYLCYLALAINWVFLLEVKDKWLVKIAPLTMALFTLPLVIIFLSVGVILLLFVEIPFLFYLCYWNLDRYQKYSNHSGLIQNLK